MRPADFRDLVSTASPTRGASRATRSCSGATTSGRTPGRACRAEPAMAKAEDLVAAYVAAGLHARSTSTAACRSRTIRRALADEVVAARPRDCPAWPRRRRRDQGPRRYVIGTEVPVPGRRARDHRRRSSPTPAGAARATLAAHRDGVRGRRARGRRGRGSWPSSCSPASSSTTCGSSTTTTRATDELRTVLDDEPDMVFEAHSTDYQSVQNLSALVADHWAVLKVGPGLTFALREALFALAAIEDEIVSRPAPVATCSRSSSADAGRGPAPWERLLHRRRRRAAHRPPVQLQRPAALLLARRPDRRGGQDGLLANLGRRGASPCRCSAVPAAAVHPRPRGRASRRRRASSSSTTSGTPCAPTPAPAARPVE